ncbi:MAG: fructokinase [Acidobacteria bacterium]|nr:fructokinase [Acidobacteriota bacterium]
MRLYGGIEGGGTKFVCAAGTGPDDIRAEARVPTTTPAETLGRAIDFFRQHPVEALGVACFGPIDPDPASPTYGRILPTPKAGWTGADVVGALRGALAVPVAFDTDVNGAALGEYRWGAARGCDPSIYLTVGTGIGGGLFAHGRLVHGLLHPEMGHIRIPHDTARDPFAGACPFHGDCFEGLASGVALEQRWGRRAESLPADHPAWDLEARYIGLALANYICTLAPQKIVIGGGVMQQARVLPLVRERTRRLLNGYIQSPLVAEAIDGYIVAPGLGSRAGVLGAIALATTADI